ncbi:MAG: 16S rRNA (uracil(1498)-N(3))-methyltransferase [Alphaproteobacteria bacterium]|nr:16S rRNA (uracil(1498)-N(3))-methyltransferase [Alphaproteobacteria bacterium]MCW5742248.1 16S rRNA (uracil(1498)-N(3))-methyltransferase [Alphaproteobacteria bacterium]
MTPRLYVEDDLAQGANVALDGPRAHYLRDVLRLAVGSDVVLFNGRDGEWLAEVTAMTRRSLDLGIVMQTGRQVAGPDLWLCFAPVKKARIDFIAEKATELGVSALVPVVTRRTHVGRVNVERLRANAVEAAEQTERLTIPEVRAPVTLERLLRGWPAGRRLLVADETGGGRPILDALRDAQPGPWAVLIGPEGGFTREELDRVAALPGVLPVGLGPRILRADTAALAALACLQAAIGDWRDSTPRRYPDYEASLERGNLMRGSGEQG